ncbi:MAG: TIGR04282 family arsenosugar biosynthesis glycosyltransferase [Burkholderiaceae bacterium]
MKPVRTIIVAKAPLPGFAKTRLIPALGAEGAARLAQRMLHHTLHTAQAAQLGPVELCMAPGPADPAWQCLDLPTNVDRSAQGEGDLGARMARAVQRTLARGQAALLIGTDCPAIDIALLHAAANALAGHDASIVPTADGGYALLGLRRFDTRLFDAMPWSTSAVAALTLQRIRELNWRVKVHPTLRDIDEPADIRWLPASWGYVGTVTPDTAPV